MKNFCAAFLFHIFQLIFVLSIDKIEAFENLLSCYKRPITVLDSSSDENVACDVKALSKQSTVVIFSENRIKIDKLLHGENKDNLIIFKQTLSNECIQLLSECEHFDVILMNMTDIGVNDSVGDYLRRLLQLGDFLVCQSKSEIDLPLLLPIKDKLYEKVFDNGTYLYIVKKGDIISILKRRHMFWPYGLHNKRHEIVSTFTEKKLIKVNCITKETISVDWINGINLISFIALNNYYPTKEMVMSAVKQLAKVLHPDWGPANMIISGASISLIDFQDWNGSNVVFNEKELMARQMAVIKDKIKCRTALIEEMFLIDGFMEKFVFYWQILNPRKLNLKDSFSF